MNLKNCERCGKLFVANAGRICNECLEQDDKDFELVRKYINEHKDVIVAEVVEHTGVTEKKILKFLKEGLISTANMKDALHCVSCGASVKDGILCGKCSGKLSKELKQTIRDENEVLRNKGEGMRIDRDRTE